MTPAGRTIAAIATPPGRGAVGIVRVSGPLAARVARQLLGKVPDARRALWTDFRTGAGEVVDRGLALYFPAPNSYTGEDVLELQAHGGPAILRLLVQEACALGAEPARPGEFTERAFLNGKLDLLQAEGVAMLIEAGNARAARAAARACAGDFSRAAQQLSASLRRARVLLEAGIDFGDDVEQGFDEAAAILREATGNVEGLLKDAEAGARLSGGLDVAIVGAPNSGKSTLLNRLCGEDRAIVTPIAGTTRDVLSIDVTIDGIEFRFHDTAGLRETEDPIEQEGVRRARRILAESDLVLHLDAAESAKSPASTQQIAAGPGQRYLEVRNKIDLVGEAASREETPCGPRVNLSALTGDGVPLLRTTLWELAGGMAVADAPFAARARHVHALQAVAVTLEAARGQLAAEAVDLCCEELRRATRLMEGLTGEWTTEDLLGEIFGSFCIGK